MEEKLPSWRWAIVSVVCLLCFMANYMQYQVSALAVEVMPMLNIDTVGTQRQPHQGARHLVP